MRTPLVAANWKMYKTVQEAVAFLKDLKALAGALSDVDIVVAPPFTAIHAAAEAVRGSNLAIAGQDVYWEREGAFTGEVGPGMLKAAGAEYVIVGHSERRTLFGETDAQVNRKVKAAIEAALTPIVCIGEMLSEREAGQTLQVLDRQLRHGLEGISPASIASLALAYEPVWAIGTGKVASSAQAQEAHEHIRNRLRGWFGAEAAAACRVLYGGSVKPANARELVSQPDVDGALVGGASLEVRGFVEIVAASRPGRI